VGQGLPGCPRDGPDCRRRSGGRDGRSPRRSSCPRRSSSRRTLCPWCARRTRNDWLHRRRHRCRSTYVVIAGVLWITRTIVFAARTPHLRAGVAVRVHVTVEVRVRARLRRSRGRPPHRCSQRGRKYEAYQSLSHRGLHPVVSLAVPRIPPLSAGKTLGNGPIARKRTELTRCGASTVGVRTHPVWLCHADKQPRAHGSVPDAPEVFRFPPSHMRLRGKEGGGGPGWGIPPSVCRPGF